MSLHAYQTLYSNKKKPESLSVRLFIGAKLDLEGFRKSLLRVETISTSLCCNESNQR